MTAVLYIDANDLSTSQQKLIDFRRRRVFPNPKVLSGMRLVEFAAKKYTTRVVNECPLGTNVSVSVTFYCKYPSATPKKNLVEGLPMPERWDLDNKAKSFLDALTKIGWWKDDRYITSLHLEKRRTTGTSRIVVFVTPHLFHGEHV